MQEQVDPEQLTSPLTPEQLDRQPRKLTGLVFCLLRYLDINRCHRKAIFDFRMIILSNIIIKQNLFHF